MLVYYQINERMLDYLCRSFKHKKHKACCLLFITFFWGPGQFLNLWHSNNASPKAAKSRRLTYDLIPRRVCAMSSPPINWSTVTPASGPSPALSSCIWSFHGNEGLQARIEAKTLQYIRLQLKGVVFLTFFRFSTICT